VEHSCLAFTETSAAGTCAGALARTWIATDLCGLATHVQTVTVQIHNSSTFVETLPTNNS
jgi:hypothetical protein